MNKYTADTIFTMNGAPLTNHVVITDDQGQILAIESKDEHSDDEIRHMGTIMCPGFINTHCHLELSHMKGKVPTGTGLIAFISDVVTKRGATPEEIQAAIAAGEKEMIEGGIVAVGDISNTTDTFIQKAKGNLRYYNFIEYFDLLQVEQTAETVKQYDVVYETLQVSGKSRKSKVPHAPYSMSKELFQAIYPNQGDQTISIHNQEMHAENELFLTKSGGMIDFMKGFGLSLDGFAPIGKTSIHYVLPKMDPNQRTLLVHNTTCTADDIAYAEQWSDQVYYATCPNANLYIENALPNYKLFMDAGAKMTIGTDSLTSNWQLSIIEEMKTIRKYASYVSVEEVLTWATINGARALGFDDELGSIEVGKKPRLVGMDEEMENLKVV